MNPDILQRAHENADLLIHHGIALMAISCLLLILSGLYKIKAN